MANFISYDQFKLNQSIKTEEPDEVIDDNEDNSIMPYGQYKELQQLEARETTDYNLPDSITVNPGDVFEPEPLGPERYVPKVPEPLDSTVAAGQEAESIALFEQLSSLSPNDLKQTYAQATSDTALPDDTMKEIPPNVTYSPDSMHEVRAMNQADWERGGILPKSKWGLLEGVTTIATGTVGFLAGMTGATAKIPFDMLDKAMQEGSMTKEDVIDVMAAANAGKEHIMEAITYAPKHSSGQTIAEIAAWPFTYAHGKIDEALVDKPDNVKEAAHFMFDFAVVAAPKIGKTAISKVKAARAKAAEGKELSPEEVKTLTEAGDSWRDTAVLEEVATLAEEKEAIHKMEAENTIKAERETTKKTVEENIADPESIESEVVSDLLADELGREPTELELQAEAKLAKADIDSLNAETNRTAELSVQYKEWQLKKAKADTDIKAELGIDTTRAPRRTIVRKPTDKNYSKEAQSETGITEFFSGADATADLYNKAFDSLTKGKDTISGIKDNLLVRHKKAFDEGKIKSPADLKAAEEKLSVKHATAEAEVKTMEARDKTIKETGEEPSTPIADVMTEHGLFTDVEATEGRRAIYAEPINAKRINKDPEFALNKLINDVNRHIHGDKDIDIAATREVIQAINDGADGFRGYFPGEGNFEMFVKSAESALEYSRIADPRFKIAKVEPTRITLRSGFDPKLASDMAKQAFAYTKAMRGERKLGKLEKIKGSADKTAERWWDIRAPAKNALDRINTEEGYNTVKTMVLQQGATTAAAVHIARMRKAVYKGLNRSDRKLANDVMFFKRTIAIDQARAREAIQTGKLRKVTHPKLNDAQMKKGKLSGKAVELDATVAKEALMELEKQLGAKKFGDLDARTEIGFKIMGDMLTLMRKENLITAQVYNKLKGVKYLRRQDIIDAIDPVNDFKIGKLSLSVRESGVKSLQKGKHNDRLEMDSELIMADIIQSTYGRIARNKTNMALMEVARVTPENGFVKIPAKLGKDGKLASPPSGWSKVDLFADGKKHRLFLKNDFARSWVAANREISFELMQKLQLVSGSAFLKPTATGANPGFALVNLVRDAAHIYVAAQVKIGGKWKGVYSPVLPKFIGQYATDMAKVSADALLRKGRWEDAVVDGMGMQFLAHEGRVFRKYEKIQGPLDKVMEVMAYITESSEILSRLAVREKAMRLKADQLGVNWGEFQKANKDIRPSYVKGQLRTNPNAKNVAPEMANKVGMIRQEGSFAARDYMDFSNHGTRGEAIDSVVPYFNAGIQGTRGMLRSAARNKTEFAAKLGQISIAASAIYAYNATQHPEKIKLVPERIRDTNFVFMTNHSFADEFGQKHWMYIKIPKDPSQQYFSKMAEGVTGLMMGDKVDLPGLKDALSVLSPVDTPLPNIPTVNAVLGAATNFDLQRSMWDGKNVKVWKGPETGEDQEKEEYVAGRGSRDTPAWAVAMGEMHGISPMRTKHAVDSYFARGVWTALPGAAANKMLGGTADESREMAVAEALAKYPVSRRFFGMTMTESEKTTDKDYEEMSSAALDSMIVKRQMGTLLHSYFNSDATKIKDLYKFRAENPRYKDRLKEDIDFALTLKKFGGNYRSFWMRMRSPTTPEVKASMYHRRWKAAETKDRTQLDFHRRKFGHTSERFNKALVEIRLEERRKGATSE